ncbi:hypothetical protein EN817_04870 [Mesorhizobium sp. M3A.F.Ca.ET.174.01.1.1]|nr:hypothetical protein EJ074_22295 [Mesorhizobium sp. M3A.F.Ca.ET.080.04.2.1]RWB67301.1 MAG: hypothetical protein EOQ49_26150 [Mesorhizobium sp.]TGS70131.1 hypothetical protein EN844_05095 [Mesorhizobium sp. M3A.F.Ca.ET.201.01.1.1]TGS88113.1 hypothetical protein EN818_04870 [Mesorhizobium sp. M3A.F.Ca.ET.175.01.1.1]TGT29057.1 hypothetical protein EN817_04870 [Mesorhizobium sp. M3A.F.Ca.ET.174.01.1.1]TGT63388.1 hypothetical protein EN813_008280 [Mesorhizobium sp. M00.F.Ca.ET.170.01.1.1]
MAILPNPDPTPIPTPPPIPDPKPMREPDPEQLPDEQPLPNPDENDAPPKRLGAAHASFLGQNKYLDKVGPSLGVEAQVCRSR